MVNKYMKKYSTSLTIKKIQIKITLRVCLTPVEMAIIKRTNNNKYGQGCRGVRKERNLMYCWWDYKYESASKCEK
jgi:hypothetical protein